MLSNDKLRFLRQHYNLTIKNIADYCQISETYVKKIEANEKHPSQEVHDKWIECCRVYRPLKVKRGRPSHKKEVE